MLNARAILAAAILASTATAGAGGVYWADRITAARAIRGCNFDRTNVRTIASLNSLGTRDPRGIAVDQANERLYFADRVTGGTAGVIAYVAISGVGGVQTAVSSLNTPADFRFDAGTRTGFWAEESGGLIRKATLPGAGGSSGLATLFSGLSLPYYLDFDTASATLYWAQNGSQIFSGPLAGGTAGPALYASGLNNRGTCVDAASGMIYWAERDGTHVIRRMPIGGGPVQTVYTGLDTPHGIVLDLPARKIYWVDTGTNAAGGFNARGVSRGDMDGATAAEIVLAGTASNQPWDVDLDRRNATFAEWTARFYRYDAPPATTALTADPDGDNLTNLAEYALGTAPLASTAAAAEGLKVNDGGVDYPAIRFRRRTTATDATIAVEIATAFGSWSTVGLTQFSAVTEPDGLELVTIRSNQPVTAGQQFLRVKVTAP